MFLIKMVNKFVLKMLISFIEQTHLFLGWGAYNLNSGDFTNGRWTEDEVQFSINYLEFLAIFYALQSLFVILSNVHIQFQCDNVQCHTLKILGACVLSRWTSLQVKYGSGVLTDIFLFQLPIYMGLKMVQQIFFPGIFQILLSGC